MSDCRKIVPAAAVEESDEEFAKAIGIILPDTEATETEDLPDMSILLGDCDPWNELHSAA